MTVGIFGFLIADGHGPHSSALRHYGGLRDLGFVAVERALHGILSGYGQSLRVMLILNQVSVIVSDFRAVVKSTTEGGVGRDGIQRFRELFVVGGELQLE